MNNTIVPTNTQEKVIFFFGTPEIYSKLIEFKKFTIRIESLRKICNIVEKYFEIKKRRMYRRLIIFIPASETEKA